MKLLISMILFFSCLAQAEPQALTMNDLKAINGEDAMYATNMLVNSKFMKYSQSYKGRTLYDIKVKYCRYNSLTEELGCSGDGTSFVIPNASHLTEILQAAGILDIYMMWGGMAYYNVQASICSGFEGEVLGQYRADLRCK